MCKRGFGQVRGPSQSQLAKRYQGSGFRSQEKRQFLNQESSTHRTCFADPVHVPVHLLLQLLLLLQEEEPGAGLHPVLLLRKLAVLKDSYSCIRLERELGRKHGKNALVKSISSCCKLASWWLWFDILQNLLHWMSRRRIGSNER